MSYAIVLLTISCLCTSFAYGMECTYKEDKNYIEKMITSCPTLWTDSSKSYCCYDLPNESYYCCTQEEFAVKMGLGIIVPVVITAGIVVSSIICCICCLFCSCCPWYRRRHRGTVYGKVHTPNVHVIQTSTSPPPNYASQTVQNHYVPSPVSIEGMPQAPPAYANEPYARQAPYNPGYAQ
ncbi:hypothetical protein KPH14_002103 [Odynerus spinipes]|uniref:Protein shisa-5-like n=1 Tax=Odynerus spinipes TaxID=1348599 RepID=A0AAD9VNT8_9HYME|nr:hypothetical protein KPH14_002103 [Odynerus spinipes]